MVAGARMLHCQPWLWPLLDLPWDSALDVYPRQLLVWMQQELQMAVVLELCFLQFLVWVPVARLLLLGCSDAVPLGQSLDWLSALPRRKLLLDFLDFLLFCSHFLHWMDEEACLSASSFSSPFLHFCYHGLSSLQASTFLFCDFWILMVMNAKG